MESCKKQECSEKESELTRKNDAKVELKEESTCEACGKEKEEVYCPSCQGVFYACGCFSRQDHLDLH